MNEHLYDMKNLYQDVSKQIIELMNMDSVPVTAMRINGQYFIGSKMSIAVKEDITKDFIRFDEIEFSFNGSYKSEELHMVIIDCCPDTNMLPYLTDFPRDELHEKIDKTLLKVNNKVDAERVDCIYSCLKNLIKRSS